MRPIISSTLLFVFFLAVYSAALFHDGSANEGSSASAALFSGRELLLLHAEFHVLPTFVGLVKLTKITENQQLLLAETVL